MKQETGDRRQESGDRRQETGGRKQGDGGMVLTWLLASCFLLLAFGPRPSQAEGPGTIVLKALIVNPSDNETQTVPVELPLPREAGKKDVINLTEGLKIVYDAEQGVYKAVGDMTLGPAEEKTVQVTIVDIWKIPEKDIRFQKGYLPTLLKVLEKTSYAGTAAELAESIRSRLDAIEKSQNETVSPSKHIAIYRENTAVMRDIKKDVRFLEKLSADKVPIFEDAIDVEGEEQKKGETADSVRTITLRMLVKNPSVTEKAILPVDYFLPPEVGEKDVISAADLEVHYDLTRAAVFLHKDGVELQPGESKIYEIVLRDLWHVEPEKVQELQVKAAGHAQGLEGTQFRKSAVKAEQKVDELAKEIFENQEKSVGQPIENHIALYVESSTTLMEMREQIARMAQMATVAAASPTTTPESMGLESGGGGSADSAASETPGMRGPEILAGTIFAGKSPEETTVWKMILAIVGFLGLVSLFFYVLWWIRLKMEKTPENQEASPGPT